MTRRVRRSRTLLRLRQQAQREGFTIIEPEAGGFVVSNCGTAKTLVTLTVATLEAVSDIVDRLRSGWNPRDDDTEKGQ